MKTFTYENQGQETLLVYHLDEEEHLDSFAKGMLQSNEIAGILRPSFVCRDGDCYLKYPVTSKIPLVDYVQKEMSRTAVLGFCQSFVCAVQEIEEYMLPKEKLLLDVDFIFVDIARKEASLVYLPIDEFTSSCSMKEFLLTFLSHLRFCMDQDVSYVAKLIHFINQTKGWSFEELRRFLTEQMEERDLRLQQNFIQSDFASDDSYSLESPQSDGFRGETVPQESLLYGNLLEESVLAESQRSKTLPGGSVVSEPQQPDGFSFGKSRGKSQQRGSMQPEIPQPDGLMSGSFLVPPEPVEQTLPKASEEEKKKKGLFSKKEKKSQEEKKKGGLFRRDKRKKGEIPPPAWENPPESEVHIFADSYQKVSLVPSQGNNGFGATEDGSGSRETVIMGSGADCGETVILGGGEREVYDSNRRVVRLTRRRNGQSVVIHKDLFHIGREGSFADFYIADNRAIGAVHADIYLVQGQYFIRDCNSLNHTYVNGKMVFAGQDQMLRTGDVITLADEDFDFMIS